MRMGASNTANIGGRMAYGMARVVLEAGERAVVIPDMHHKWKWAEAIIRSESPDRAIFLGDYFDDFNDTPIHAGVTAKWLAGSLADSTRVHLVGNHDIHYMSSLPYLGCSGYDPRKRAAIEMCGVEWARLEPYCWLGMAGGDVADAWLCTHAGLSAAFLESVRPGATAGDVEDVLGAARADLDRINDAECGHAFFQAGRARRGRAPTGGIVWCDYRIEFEDVPGLRQIFGHTPGTAVRYGRMADGAEHFCIDTALQHYIAYEDGRAAVRTVGGVQ